MTTKATPTATATSTTQFNSTDPLNLAGLATILSDIPQSSPWVWLLVTLLIRFLMTELRLDNPSGGIVGLIFSTVTKAHITTTTDPEWSQVLHDCALPDTMVNFGDTVQVPKRSIRWHSWHCAEYWIDCISPKKHMMLQEEIRDLEGIITKVLKWRERSPYVMSRVGGFTPVRAYRWSSMPIQHLRNRDNYELLRMAYGSRDIRNIYGGRGVYASLHWDRTKVALSAITSFTLFGWGLTFQNLAVAIPLIIIFDILTLAAWSWCWFVPSNGAWTFCQVISRNADLIHEAGRAFLKDRDTVDVILYPDRGQHWTWCRIGDTWVSVMIPTERPVAEYALGILSLFAHTLLPIGWFNETNITPNILFALIAISLEHSGSPYICTAGTAIASILHSLDIQPPKSGDWWILSYYVFLYGRISGGYNLQPFLNWVFLLASLIGIQVRVFSKTEYLLYEDAECDAFFVVQPRKTLGGSNSGPVGFISLKLWAIPETLSAAGSRLAMYSMSISIIPDPEHFRINVNLGWEKLNKYYSLLDETPIYYTALALHLAFRWAYFETEWKDNIDWVTKAQCC